MRKKRPTQDEIYRQGLEALCDRLGRAGMIRFLQHFETGRGNYARARHAWVDRLSLEAIRELSASSKSAPKRRKR